jgi:peptidoglycan-associated lipoprotein
MGFESPRLRSSFLSILGKGIEEMLRIARTSVVFLLMLSLAILPACSKKKIYSEPAAGMGAAGARGSGAYGGAGTGGRAGGFDEQGLKGSAGGAGAAGGGLSGAGSAGYGAATRASLVSEDIFFEYDSSALLPEARDLLKKKAEFLVANPQISIIIEGHTDERGTIEYNIALGERRAESVQAFLLGLGVAASRMSTVSYGKEKPIDPGHNEAAWAKNRRVHIEIR